MNKILFIGGDRVGKSCLIHRIKTGRILQDSNKIVTSTSFESLVYKDRRLALWEIRNTEAAIRVMPMYISSAVSICICIDPIEDDVEAVDSLVVSCMKINPLANIILVATKCDRFGGTRTPLEEYCNIRNIPLILCSSYTGNGIDTLADLLFEYDKKYEDSLTVTTINTDDVKFKVKKSLRDKTCKCM